MDIRSTYEQVFICTVFVTVIPILFHELTILVDTLTFQGFLYIDIITEHLRFLGHLSASNT